MEENLETYHKITRRHVARLLTLLENMGATPDMISSIKAEMWDLHNDLIASKASNGSNVWKADT